MILSPAKSLDFAPPQMDLHSVPSYLERADEIALLLKRMEADELGELLGISARLSTLNHLRYAAFDPAATAGTIDGPIDGKYKQAVLAYDGPAYRALDAATLPSEALHYLQSHLSIISGLYGALRPLDLIQPYRLEMATKTRERLPSLPKPSLHAYWREALTAHISQSLTAHEDVALVNLASKEYSKALDLRGLRSQGVHVVDVTFKEGGRVVGVHSKRARGLMTRFLCERQACHADELRRFDVDGYSFQATESTDEHLVFDRPANGKR